MTGVFARMEQAGIIEIQGVADVPRCRLCPRPARWLIPRQQFAPYCSGQHCGNRERICQTCGSTFTMNVDGAGTRYCSAPCKGTGYRAGHDARSQPVACAWCGTRCPNPRKRGIWPYICAECLAPIKHVADRLKAHHVPHERARQLVADPHCEICGRDVLVKHRDPNTGKLAALLVVDHDHNCPRERTSCGRCVRGLICRHCNIAAGMLQDSAPIATALARYLEDHVFLEAGG